MRSTRVLLYHGFCEEPLADDPFHLFVPLEAFCRQLAHLRAGGWRPLSLSAYEAAARRAPRDRAFLLTIDDAYDAVATLALPRLAAAGVPAVLFVPPAHVGGRATWLDHPRDVAIMDEQTLRAMPEFGVEVGVHGFDHTPMIWMTDAELRRQTREARDAVADLTGTAPRAFAYPYGLHDERARQAVRRAGFTVAFSVTEGGGRYAIPRLDVNGVDSDATFGLKLMPGYRHATRVANHLGPAKRWGRRLLRAR